MVDVAVVTAEVVVVVVVDVAAAVVVTTGCVVASVLTSHSPLLLCELCGEVCVSGPTPAESKNAKNEKVFLLMPAVLILCPYAWHWFLLRPALSFANQKIPSQNGALLHMSRQSARVTDDL